MTVRPAELTTALKDFKVDARPYPFSQRPWYSFTTVGGFAPVGVMHHHTTGPADLLKPGMNAAKASMLKLLRNGRSDLVGPLCHLAPVFMGKDQHVVYLIGWGNVNHSGLMAATVAAQVRTGTYRGARPGPDSVDGNPLLYGFEYLHPGTAVAWPDELLEAGHRAAAAVAQAEGWTPSHWAGSNLEHREGTGRKIDRSWKNFGKGLRTRIAELAAPEPDQLDGWPRGPKVQALLDDMQALAASLDDDGHPRMARFIRHQRVDVAEKFPKE